MAWFKWPRFRKAQLGQSETANYRSAGSFTASSVFHWEDRPIFSILAAEMMLLDPKVTLGLAVRNGLVKQGEVEVEDAHPKIRKFVADQFEKIWKTSASLLLTPKHVGFAGFEPMFEIDRA